MITRVQISSKFIDGSSLRVSQIIRDSHNDVLNLIGVDKTSPRKMNSNRFLYKKKFRDSMHEFRILVVVQEYVPSRLVIHRYVMEKDIVTSKFEIVETDEGVIVENSVTKKSALGLLPKFICAPIGANNFWLEQLKFKCENNPLLGEL